MARLVPASTRPSSSSARAAWSPNCSTAGSSSGGAGCGAARGVLAATGPGRRRGGRGSAVPWVSFVRRPESVACRTCRCVPAPCSDPDRPTPTRRPPSPSGSRCSGTSTRSSSASSTRPPTGCGRCSGRRTGAPCRCRRPARRAWRRRSSTRWARATSSSSRSTACSGSGWSRSPRGAGPRSSPSSTSGGSRSTPTRVLAAHPSPKLIAAVHAETSTGVLSDLEPLAAGKGDALLLADCVTSLGGIPVRLDDWGVDLAYSGSQKCLGVAPGPGAVHDQRPGVGAADREAAELVPRPRAARRLRGRGGRLRRADLPPHRADGHGRLAARGARPDPRGGSGRRPRPARRGRPAAARGPGRAGARAVRRRGAPAAGADDGAGARRRRLGRRPQGAARALRPGDRRGSGRLRGHRLADRPDGPERRPGQGRCWCWPP